MSLVCFRECLTHQSYIEIYRRSRNFTTITTRSTNSDPATLKRASKYMIIFPVVYVCCTLPLAAGRMAAMTGMVIPYWWYCVAGAAITSNGWLDVMLYVMTRRVLVCSSSLCIRRSLAAHARRSSAALHHLATTSASTHWAGSTAATHSSGAPPLRLKGRSVTASRGRSRWGSSAADGPRATRDAIRTRTISRRPPKASSPPIPPSRSPPTPCQAFTRAQTSV